jgi:hypothetical protein
MKITTKIFLLITFVLCFSCEDKGLIVKCVDCYPNEPVKTELELKLDLAYFGTETLINVYEGNLEDSILYSSYTVTGESKTVTVTLNKKYTVTATYYVPYDYYTAIDSATPRVKLEKSQCNDPCYFVYDKTIDLRLKYTR